MSGRPNDNRPTVHLTPAEQIQFLRLIHHETDPGGRRLLAWVGPADAQTGATPALDAALARLWRAPETAPVEPDATINLGTIWPGSP